MLKERSADVYERFNTRAPNTYIPLGSRIQKNLVNYRLDAKETTSDRSEDFRSQRSHRNVDTRNDELERLRKENADLKRRLSLKATCSCKAPYVE